MQDSETVFNNLSKQVKEKNYNLKRLYRILYNPDVYKTSREILTKNGLNLTEEYDFNELLEVLKNEQYQPEKSPELRAGSLIKKDGPVVETVCRILSSVFELPDSSLWNTTKARNALKKVRKEMGGYTWFLSADLSCILGQFSRERLIEIMRERISDERFLRLIRKFLNKGYLADLREGKSFSALPEGGLLAPVLLDIYLKPLDEFLSSYPLGSDQKLGFIRCGTALFVGFSGKKSELRQIRDEIEDFLREELEIKEPSFEDRISTDKALYLGYEIKKIKPSKEVPESQIELRIPDKLFKTYIKRSKLVRNIGEKPWHPIHWPWLINYSDQEILNTYNKELLKFYSYYSLAENVSVKCAQLRHVIEYSCLKTLAGKHKSTVSKMKTKLRHGKEWGVTGENGRLITLYKGFRKKSE